MANRSVNVRIGPLSLLTLITIILMAVLAMLCVTTANATSAMTTRQAESTAQSYLLDSCAQRVVAAIDSELSSASSVSAAESSIQSHANTIAATAVSGAKANSTSAAAEGDLSCAITVSDNTITITVVSAQDKRLDASLVLNTNKTYSITNWKTTSIQQEAEETLWSGQTSSL